MFQHLTSCGLMEERKSIPLDDNLSAHACWRGGQTRAGGLLQSGRNDQSIQTHDYGDLLCANLPNSNREIEYA
jgi:hypothetical protein